MNIKRAIFIVAAIVPLLALFSTPPSFTLMVFFVFCIVMAFPELFWWRVFVKFPVLPTHLISAFLVGVLTETLAWFHNYSSNFAVEGAVYSTSYLQNIIVGIWHYLAVAVAFNVIARKYLFKPGSVFITSGIVGVFLEQEGRAVTAAVASFMTNPVLGVLMIVYVFLVHGSLAALAFIPVSDRFSASDKKWYQYPLVAILIVVFVFFSSFLGKAFI